MALPSAHGGMGRPMGFQKALGQGSLALQPGLGCGMLGTSLGKELILWVPLHMLTPPLLSPIQVPFCDLGPLCKDLKSPRVHH